MALGLLEDRLLAEQKWVIERLEREFNKFNEQLAQRDQTDLALPLAPILPQSMAAITQNFPTIGEFSRQKGEKIFHSEIYQRVGGARLAGLPRWLLEQVQNKTFGQSIYKLRRGNEPGEWRPRDMEFAWHRAADEILKEDGAHKWLDVPVRAFRMSERANRAFQGHIEGLITLRQILGISYRDLKKGRAVGSGCRGEFLGIVEACRQLAREQSDFCQWRHPLLRPVSTQAAVIQAVLVRREDWVRQTAFRNRIETLFEWTCRDLQHNHGHWIYQLELENAAKEFKPLFDFTDLFEATGNLGELTRQINYQDKKFEGVGPAALLDLTEFLIWCRDTRQSSTVACAA